MKEKARQRRIAMLRRQIERLGELLAHTKEEKEVNLLLDLMKSALQEVRRLEKEQE